MQPGWPSQAGFVSVRLAVAADVPELESIAKAAYFPYVPRMGFLRASLACLKYGSTPTWP